MTSEKKGAVSPLMRQLAGYIATATRKGLPPAVAEKTRHHVLDTIAAMVSGSRLPPGRMAISHVKTLGGVREATVVGSTMRDQRGQCRARQRHAGARRRNRRLARAGPHAPRLRHRLRGAGDGRALAPRRYGVAARGGAGLRRGRAVEPVAAAGRFPHGWAISRTASARRSARPRPAPRSPASTRTRCAGRCPTPRSRRAGSPPTCATPTTSRKRSISAACRPATASPPPPWLRRAAPRWTTCSRASAISSSRTTSPAASGKRRSRASSRAASAPTTRSSTPTSSAGRWVRRSRRRSTRCSS